MNLLQRATKWLNKRDYMHSPEYLYSLGMPSAAGPVVTEHNALRSGAVWACVRIISETIASLPLVLYERGERSRTPARNHAAFPLLHDLANPEMTAMEMREVQLGHVLTWGMGWAEKEYNSRGELVGLWPLRPDKFEKAIWQGTGRDRRLWWEYRLPNHTTTWLPADRLLTLRGFSFDGVWGYSPIQVAARQAIGLSLATEEFGSRFFSNGARPGIVIKHPGHLTPRSRENLMSSWSNQHQGLSNAQRTAILEEGMDIETIGIPPEAAQFLETRKFQVTEIARIFRVPPHMLADLERATFSNIEHQSIEFVMHTLRPWLVRLEQSIQRDILEPSERQRFFAKHIVEGLLRGDTATRMQAYNTAIMSGHMSPNEARELEDNNPVEGLDYYLAPLNMVMVGPDAPQTPAPAQEEPPQPEEDESEGRAKKSPEGALHLLGRALVEGYDDYADDGLEKLTLADVIARFKEDDDHDHEHEHDEWRISPEVSDPQPDDERAQRQAASRRDTMNRHVRLFQDVADRVTRREVNDIRRAIPRHLNRRSISDFESWLEDFYQELREWMPGYYRSLMETYAETIMTDVADEIGGEPAPLDDELREWITSYLENFTNVYAVGSEKQLRALLAEAESEEEAEAAINERMDGWEETKAQKTALDQAFEAGNALVTYGFVFGGVEYLRWAATGESCPLCQKLDGTRIPINGSFLEAGDTLEAEGAAPLPVQRTIRHGPAHSGCDCQITRG